MAPECIWTLLLGKMELPKRMPKRNGAQKGSPTPSLHTGCGALYVRSKERTEWSTGTGGQAPTAV